MLTKPTLGPQSELLEEERAVGKPVLSPMAGMVFPATRRQPVERYTTGELTTEDVLAMSEEEYAAAVWSVDLGIRVWKLNHDAGDRARPLPPHPSLVKK
ncbi:MAG: hypothetical protein WBF54_15395 [Terriglobales bacterium]